MASEKEGVRESESGSDSYAQAGGQGAGDNSTAPSLPANAKWLIPSIIIVFMLLVLATIMAIMAR